MNQDFINWACNRAMATFVDEPHSSKNKYCRNIWATCGRYIIAGTITSMDDDLRERIGGFNYNWIKMPPFLLYLMLLLIIKTNELLRRAHIRSDETELVSQ